MKTGKNLKIMLTALALMTVLCVTGTTSETTLYKAYAEADNMADGSDSAEDGNTANTGDNTEDNTGDNSETDNTANTGNNSKKDNNITEKEGIVIQIGKEEKTVEILKGSFVQKKGIKYFKKKNGKFAKNRFFRKGNKVYHVNSKGKVSLGWNKIKGHYYFFDRKSGKMSCDKIIDRIKITKKGIAKETKHNIRIIKVYMEAQKVVQRVSKPAGSKSGKLYKCYLWMAKFQYKRYRTMKAAKINYPNSWDIAFANDIFKKHNGCCASEASAFAYMAKVCGYEDVSICSDGGHAWVDIGGKLYDPLFAEARSFRKNYNARYSDYRKRPAYKKKL